MKREDMYRLLTELKVEFKRKAALDGNFGYSEHC